MSKSTKLTSRQESLLQEALRRHIHFYSGWELTDAWTGLGCRTAYKPVLSAGLMTWVHDEPRFRCMGWLRLTESGAEIVQAWLDEMTEETTK